MEVTIAVAAVAAADFALDKVKDALYNTVKDKVIGRWSEHRARQFFEAFIDEVRKEKDVLSSSAQLNDMLQSLAESDERTSAIFDAYRRVALSASKDIGPMAIGLLTARIVLEGRVADEIEEMVFGGAEVLNDRDFTSFQVWMRSFGHANGGYKSEQDQQRTRGATPASIEISARDGPPLNVINGIGSFALKLKNIGLLEEKNSPYGHPRNPNSTLYYVHVTPACEQLYDLVVRASEAAAMRRVLPG